MKTTPAIDNAVAYFNAHTGEINVDTRDRVASSIIDTRTAEGSTVRFYNSDDVKFMTLKSDVVSKQFAALFDEKLVGVRHEEDGRLYAILKDEDDRIREAAVGPLPFASVQVGPDCEFGRRISAVAIEYRPSSVTVSLVAPFAELVAATRPYTDGEADELL